MTTWTLASIYIVLALNSLFNIATMVVVGLLFYGMNPPCP